MVGNRFERVVGRCPAAERPRVRPSGLSVGFLLFAALVAAACAKGGEHASPSSSTTATSANSTSSTGSDATTRTSSTTPPNVGTPHRVTAQALTVEGSVLPPSKTSEGTSRPETGPTEGSDAHRPSATASKVGSVKKVVNPAARVNDTEVSAGDAITAGAVLTTNEFGVIRFALNDKKFDDCQLSRQGSVRVKPSSRVAMALNGGRLLCGTNNSRSERTLEAPDSVFTMRDPVFLIDATNGPVTLQVARGFVEARSAVAGAAGRLVGPGAAYTVPREAGAGPVRPFDTRELTEVEQGAASEMLAALPQPSFALPPSKGSPALARFENGEAIRVGIDDEEDDAHKAFMKEFLGFVADEWGVSLQVRARARYSVGIAGSAVAQREDELGRDVDLIVSTGQKAEKAKNIPFFDDGGDHVWSLFVDQADSGFAAAVRDFLVNALDIGEYRNRYVAAFGRQPTYEAVRPLIFE